MGPENTSKLKIDVDVRIHTSMVVRTAILKRNASEKNEENAKCG